VVIGAYQDEQINLGKAAELLGLSTRRDLTYGLSRTLFLSRRLGSFPCQFQYITIQIRAQAESLSDHIIDQGLHGRNQGGLFGIQQSPQGSHDLQPYRFSQLTGLKIIQPS
jgi:hypothetical protein